jgi:hypothetical protein
MNVSYVETIRPKYKLQIIIIIIIIIIILFVCFLRWINVFFLQSLPLISLWLYVVFVHKIITFIYTVLCLWLLAWHINNKELNWIIPTSSGSCRRRYDL